MIVSDNGVRRHSRSAFHLPWQLGHISGEEFDAIVARALAKNPQGRFQDAGKFAEALRAIKLPA